MQLVALLQVLHSGIHDKHFKLTLAGSGKYPLLQKHFPSITSEDFALQVKHVVSEEHEEHSTLQQPCPREEQLHEAWYLVPDVELMHEQSFEFMNSQLLVGQSHLICEEPLQP
jgi:hypothetical protein